MAQTGDAVALFQSLMSATWYGVVGDGATPGGIAATLELVDDEAVITTDVLVGPKGEPGKAAPIVQLQWPALDDPADLDKFRPTLTDKDAGKAWWIGSVVYVWGGKDFYMVRPGPAGPPGKVPQISVTAETIPMADREPGMTDEVEQSGTSLNPHLHFKLLSPQGPPGPSTNILNAPDYDNSGGAPKNGHTLVWNSTKSKWVPSDLASRRPKLYSIPEAAFQSYGGSVQRRAVVSYTLEEQDYDYVPYVTGHLRAFGLTLSNDPMTVGCEVLLGDPLSGQMIARGFGNISTWTHILPHFSTPGSTTDAVSPDNNVAVVKAGEKAQITCNLYNDGLLGFFTFNRTNAQLSILTVPVGF